MSMCNFTKIMQNLRGYMVIGGGFDYDELKLKTQCSLSLINIYKYIVSTLMQSHHLFYLLDKSMC